MRTIASSCSSSNRCGLTARIASRSARTRDRSTVVTSKMASGGMFDSRLTDHVRNLPEVGQKHARFARRVLQLLGRRRERGAVAGEKGRLHPELLGRHEVLIDPRADVQDFLRANAFGFQHTECLKEEPLGRLAAAYV